MGNCCKEQSLTSNEAENFIRSVINKLKIKQFSLNEIEEHLTKTIGISLLDINNTSLTKWLTEEKYDQIIETFFIDKHFNKNDENYRNLSLIESQKFLILDYRESIGNYSFNFVLYIWLICLTETKNKQQIKTKVKFIEKIIITSKKILTFNSFKSFLNVYLELGLQRFTINFIEHPKLKEMLYVNDYKELLNDVYIEKNIKHFKQNILNDFLHQLIGTYRELSTNIHNEFLTTKDLNEFFKDHAYLLDIVELRYHFYKNYSSNIFIPED